MNIEIGFSDYAAAMPEQHNALRRSVLALRRGGVHTMEQLQHLYLYDPDQLKGLRDIGPKRMALIGEILRFYQD